MTTVVRITAYAPDGLGSAQENPRVIKTFWSLSPEELLIRTLRRVKASPAQCRIGVWGGWPTLFGPADPALGMEGGARSSNEGEVPSAGATQNLVPLAFFWDGHDEAALRIGFASLTPGPVTPSSSEGKARAIGRQI